MSVGALVLAQRMYNLKVSIFKIRVCQEIIAM